MNIFYDIQNLELDFTIYFSGDSTMSAELPPRSACAGGLFLDY